MQVNQSLVCKLIYVIFGLGHSIKFQKYTSSMNTVSPKKRGFENPFVSNTPLLWSHTIGHLYFPMLNGVFHGCVNSKESLTSQGPALGFAYVNILTPKNGISSCGENRVERYILVDQTFIVAFSSLFARKSSKTTLDFQWISIILSSKPPRGQNIEAHIFNPSRNDFNLVS